MDMDMDLPARTMQFNDHVLCDRTLGTDVFWLKVKSVCISYRRATGESKEEASLNAIYPEIRLRS